MPKKTLALEYFKAPPFDVILDPSRFKGDWVAPFGRSAPLHVEIGMGLGQHLVAFALANPGANHVGLELKMHRIYTARRRGLREGARHLRYVIGDAATALESFADGEIHRLTLLFPDPWSLGRFADRRLTHPARLATYRRVLAPGGILHFRTDDPELFAYSQVGLDQAGFAIEAAVRLDRVLTDYERRWLSEGRQIYGLDAWIPEGI